MFFVRADGNAEIGSGHLMRCLAVAAQIRRRQDICVLCGDEDSAALAKELGFPARVLGEIPFSQTEAQKACRMITECTGGSHSPREAVILTDSYQMEAEYVAALSRTARVVCFDDMARMAYPDAWKIINYNIFAQRETYERLYGVQEGTKREDLPEFLLGCAYIPLRSQFHGLEYQVRDTVQQMLITTGGGDADNIAGAVLNRLLEEDAGEKPVYHVVCGPFSPNYLRLRELTDRYDHIRLHKNVENMAVLMQQCDLAVTAGGTTVYELCAAGVPFVCFSYAENQKRLAECMMDMGMGAGDYSREPRKVLDDIAGWVRAMRQDEEGRRRLSGMERKLVDGQGSRRLAGKLCGE